MLKDGGGAVIGHQTKSLKEEIHEKKHRNCPKRDENVMTRFVK